MRTTPVMVVAAVLAGVLTGCGGDAPARADRNTSPADVTGSPAASTVPAATVHRKRPHHHVTTPTVSTTPPAATTGVRFAWHTSSVSAADLGDSWRPGCPVGPSSLRALSLTYWGFDHAAHRGTLVVNASSVSAYVSAFRAIYTHRFPIRQMVPISAYGGSDDRSMAHDNTSAFNCRYAVSNGPKHWSMHAYGNAVDINPRENPYRLNGEVLPPQGEPYMDRSDVRPGMVVEGSAPVRAFDALGWGWGGRWSSTPDYQHFSSTGG